MIRKIIQIDKEKCNGCGLCADACHEGAIGMINQKASLLRDDYCDGLGDCLPACPTGAITFIEREADPYDADAVMENMKKRLQPTAERLSGGCPGSQARRLEPNKTTPAFREAPAPDSQLSQWPVQIQLAPVKAPYFNNARLLIAADCSAYAYGSFHQDFIQGNITLIGCPKLDAEDYSKKLTEILVQNDIQKLTIVRMEVPCCRGIEQACLTALKNSGKSILCQVVTISTNGRILG